MYAAVIVQNNSIDSVLLFETFPVWLEGVGTIEGPSDPNLWPTDYGLHVEIVTAWTQRPQNPRLQKALDSSRNCAKVFGYQNVWIKTHPKGGYLNAVVKNDESIEVSFDLEGEVLTTGKVP